MYFSKYSLTNSPNNAFNYPPVQDDIISLDRNEDNMNFLQAEDELTNKLNHHHHLSLSINFSTPTQSLLLQTPNNPPIPLSEYQ